MMCGDNGASGGKSARHALEPSSREERNADSGAKSLPLGGSGGSGTYLHTGPELCSTENDGLEPSASFSPLPPFALASDEPPPDDREPEPFRQPEPCPACGGRGVIGERDTFGNWEPCDVCEGSAIDPDDPESPL
jgi:hypothetical protein